MIYHRVEFIRFAPKLFPMFTPRQPQRVPQSLSLFFYAVMFCSVCPPFGAVSWSSYWKVGGRNEMKEMRNGMAHCWRAEKLLVVDHCTWAGRGNGFLFISIANGGVSSCKGDLFVGRAHYCPEDKFDTITEDFDDHHGVSCLLLACCAALGK